jgi:hypothetical protein
MEPFCLIVVDGSYTITFKEPKDKPPAFRVTPGLPIHTLPHKITVGDGLELRRPDGSVKSTILAGFEHAKHRNGTSSYPLVMPPSITAADVPVGTSIWWVAEREKPAKL